MVGSGVIMEKTGDKLAKSSQQSDLYNYNLDHVYCSDNSRYRNAGTHLNLAAAASDLKSLRKENKQLQAMLLLHLDLIQEQSNQLIAKDKQLLQLREENAQLRLKCERNAANERRQNNNRYTGHTSAKVLHTSGGSPTIESYFATADAKLINRAVHDANTNHENRAQITNTNQNILLNSSNAMPMRANENQSINEIRNNQIAFPVKIEVNSVDDGTKLHTNALSDIAAMRDNRLKMVTPTSFINAAHDKSIPVKYRAIENNIIGHNNGKLISKIILQRKKSENGEKIFVRTKNIEIGSNNRVSYEKWSPLRPIKTEVIENECERETVVLESASASPSPKSNATPTTPTTPTAINDDEISSCDTMEASYLTAAPDSPTPSIKTTIGDHSDLPPDCQMDCIKIEQEMDEFQESAHNSPAYDPNDTMDDSQDGSNIESPLTSESMPTGPTSASPIASTVSTCDFNQSDAFNTNSNSMIATGSTTILYPTKQHLTRNAILTTKKPYKIREWQLDEIEAELKQEITDEVCKEENEANLELPKWRTWELSSNREVPVHSREYEDLSDDAFARRHARFLLDERKRKKWDVQRIREQRTIERLKRRHCKDELNQQKDFNEITTFFPTVDQLKSIQITDDLPVSAFGESIPLLPAAEFSLPWLSADSMPAEQLSAPDFQFRLSSNCGSASMEPTTVSSSIIFLAKKRAGRTRTSLSHSIPHSSVKGAT